MNILLLAPHPYYVDRGTPIDVDILLRALSARGDHVDVVTFHEGRDTAYRNVTLHRIRKPPLIGEIAPGFSVKKLVCDLLLLGTACRLARHRRYDVVHAGEEAVFIAMLLQRLFGTPYVYDMDSSIAQQMVEQMPRLQRLARLFDACEAAAIRGSVAVAPVCNALADLARRKGAGYVEALHDISQLTDPDGRGTGMLRRKTGARGTMLMYVGNLEKYQGVDLLLEAMAVVRTSDPDVSLVVVGGTPRQISAYERKARGLGIADTVHFIGPWPLQQLGALLAEADILTAPRIKGINTPMKIFPYLHSGRPLIVTDLPTHNQILDQTVAMLCPPDPHGLARGITRLARDPDLRRRLGAAGRRFVEQNHTFEAHQTRVNRLYEHVERACAVRAGDTGVLTATGAQS